MFPCATVAAVTSTTNPLSGGVSPLSPIPTTTTPTAVVTNTSTAGSGSSSLSSSSALVIVVGAAIVLGGIAFFIWRDARRRAPVRGRGGEATLGDGRRTGSKPPPKPRKLSPAERRRRKRGKAR